MLHELQTGRIGINLIGTCMYLFMLNVLGCYHWHGGGGGGGGRRFFFLGGGR